MYDAVEIAEALSIVPGLPSPECSALAKHVRVRLYEPGERVCRYEDKGRDLYFLLEGELTVSRASSKGAAVLLTTMLRGEIFGEVALWTDGPRTVDVTARTGSVVGVISWEALQQLRKQLPTLFRMMEISLALRVERLTAQLADLALLKVPQRLVRALKRRAHPASEGEWVVEKVPSQRELAEEVGASREMVNRAMKVLRARKVLRWEGEHTLVIMANF